MTQPDSTSPLAVLVWPLRLTLLALWVERLGRAFWAFASVLALIVTALAFGLPDHLPLELAWIGLVLAGLALLASLLAVLRGFRPPTRADALARLDAGLPGQPIAALTDQQALGRDDADSQALWQAHQARMARRLAGARAVPPRLDLTERDPYGLRLVALTGLVMALLFGSVGRVGSVAGLAPGGNQTVASGPTWEGWAQPPAYTGKPTLYLNKTPGGTLSVPMGTRIQIRLYGTVGDLTLAETVSTRTDAPPASDPTQDFVVKQAGKVTIDGPGGQSWTITPIPDQPPEIQPSDRLDRLANGKLKQRFTASDDYAVVSGQVSITLDLPAVERRIGLSIDPEPRPPVVLDLPLPMGRNRSDFAGTLADDLSQHPFANLPVTMVFEVRDAAGQTGRAAPLQVVLPGKRFFDPVAAALIEMRQGLLWNRANAPLVAQILKAVTHKPEGLIRNERAYLRLRVALRDLDAGKANLSADARDALVQEFWQIALLVEEGDLTSKLEALRRAQDRLDEAIRNGASPGEIDQLMQEMQQALNNYMRELGEQAERQPQLSQDMDGLKLSGDQLQQMLDELQKLMKEGRTAEAQELMEMLRQLMENMQVVQDQSGQSGQSGPGQQAMRDLQDTLRDQQDLSDDAYRDLQDGREDGQAPGSAPDADPEGEGSAADDRPLAERQQDLANRLGQMQQGPLPGDGSDAGESGRQDLDQAGRAMREAEQALREGDLGRALDRQAEAMQAMRDGLRNLGEALADAQREPGETRPTDGMTQADPQGQRDPLGREPGNSARMGSDRNLLQGQDVYRRAQDLLDEIRRRSGEATRPEAERDYLRRLLDLF